MNKYIAFIALIVAVGCQPSNVGPLPKLGQWDIDENGDTVYYQVPPFSMMNQDSQLLSEASFRNGFYIADFFFTSCPSICPKVKQQMLRIDESFAKEERLHFMSFSIDYLTDSIPVLKTYASKLGMEAERWQFVQLDSAYDKVANKYLSIAYEDAEAPGGFDHSGRLILVDDQRHIRAICDGTDVEDVDQFMKDIKKLAQEYDQRND